MAGLLGIGGGFLAGVTLSDVLGSAIQIASFVVGLFLILVIAKRFGYGVSMAGISGGRGGLQAAGGSAGQPVRA